MNEMRPSTRAETRAWAGLGLGAVVTTTLLLFGPHARSWHYFSDAGRGLLDRALYRDHPEFQFGPAAALVARMFSVVPGLLPWAAMVTGSAVGAVTWWMICRAVGWPSDRTRHALVWAVGAAFLVPWIRMAAYSAHIDDVVVLAATVAAVWSLTRRRWGFATVFVAIAVAVKPWAVLVAPLLLTPHVPHRWRRLVGVGGLVAASWAAYLSAPGTIEALSGFGIPVDPNSGLRALGFLDLSTPGWLRPVQIGLGLGAATVAARRSGPLTVPLAGIAVRLALDPATHHYYTAGFVVAALLAELSRPGVSWPWRTMVGAAVLEMAASDVVLGGYMPIIRLAVLTLVVMSACRTRRPALTSSTVEQRTRSWPLSTPPSRLSPLQSALSSTGEQWRHGHIPELHPPDTRVD